MFSIVNGTPSTGSSFAWQSANWWRIATRRAAIFAHFWSKVQRADAKACWPFLGPTHDNGYGYFTFVDDGLKVRYRANRFAWLASRGEIPEGMDVCHRCDVPHCVNPDHLFVASHRENLRDSIRKGRKRTWGVQKLNAEQVRQIRARCAAGERQKDVAAAFGIARNTVSGIVNRKSWAHLDDSAERRQAS